MTSRKKRIITAIGALLTIILILIAGSLLSAHKIAENPADTVGNTAGNLYNGGYFCEKDGMVYFCNIYDNHSLYSMDILEKDVKKLGNVSICNLLAGENTLYFFQRDASHSMENVFGTASSPTSLNACDFKGKNISVIQDGIILGAQLVGNHIYIMMTDNKQNTFLKVTADGKEPQELAKEYIHPGCGDNGIIYYTDPSTHSLIALDTASDVPREILSGNIWFPMKDGNYIYYLDADRNYNLCRYDMTGQTIEILTKDRVDYYNMGNGYIYYQTAGSSPALKYMFQDGSNPHILASGAFCNIQVTSAYVYFQAFQQEDIMYHAFLGDSIYTEFTAAKEAVE